ncbi:TPA: DNA-binding protein [Streptococcus suis]
MEALLSEKASEEFVNSLLDLIERKVEERLLQKEKRYLMQKEVFEEYNCNSKIIQDWERAGLKRFRMGKRWLYDRKDIEAVIETLKQ